MTETTEAVTAVQMELLKSSELFGVPRFALPNCAYDKFISSETAKILRRGKNFF